MLRRAQQHEQHEREELEAVLNSETFRRSLHSARLLQYVCDKYWEQRPEEIKEYNLAVEALGRHPDFDPAESPTVRVEMHRLREKLKKYYSGEGADHALVIELQAGNYVPQFIRREIMDSAADVPAHDVVEIADQLVPNSLEPLSHGSVPFSSPGEGKLAHPFSTKRLVGWPVAALATALAVLSLVLLIPKVRRIPVAHGAVPQHELAATRRAAPVAFDAPIRIISGYSRDSYIASEGNEFGADRFFKGGYVLTPTQQFIARTRDPTLFAYGRAGDFSYDIPLKSGPHNLWLYFNVTKTGPGSDAAESGEGRGIFKISLNGKPLLEWFDPYIDAGGNFAADARVFKDIEPAPDGYLHLAFTRIEGAPTLSGLAIVPSTRGRMNPIRMIAQDNSFTDHSGRVWQPDSYFMRGRLMSRSVDVASALDPGLYQSERWGYFDYAIPVAEGKYGVTLYFAETWYGWLAPGGVGSRLFDVYCNYDPLLKNFDVFKEAGGTNRAIQKTFHGLQPNVRGKLDLIFEPVKNYAFINAIEVEDESP